MKYNSNFIYGNVPEEIKTGTKNNMESRQMSFYSAFKAAVDDYTPERESELFKAWYYNDFRRFIPAAYDHIFLDFNKFPLKYTV